MKYYAGAHVLEPAYMQKFACIGEACQDNCCHSRVDIDKEAFKLYKALSESPLKRRILDSIKTYTDGNECKYAHMRINPGEPCPMLNDNGLCGIHRGLGEGYLSLSCYTVPKVVNRVGGCFEKSLMLFCPEACRLVVLSPDIMEFESYISDESTRLHIRKDISQSLSGQIQPAWFEIRSAFIDILQDRRFDFGRRMLLAGLVAVEIETMNARGVSAPEIISLLDGMAAYYSTETASADMNSLCYKDDTALGSLLAHAYDKLIQPMEGASDAQFVRYVRLAKEGLGIHVAPAGAAVRYTAAKIGYLQPYLNGRYIYEQYFVNALFGRAFPLRNRKSLFEEYMILVLYYFLMDLMLAGISAASRGIDDAICVDFIHRFAKGMEYGSAFEDMMGEFIVMEKLCNIDAVATLTACGV